MKTLSRMISFWLLGLLPLGAVELPVECRVHNIGPMCAWASLDTLARCHGVAKLVGVMEDRRRNKPDEKAFDDVIRAELDRRGVDYRFTPQSSFDRQYLEHYTEHYGVAVALKEGNPHSIGCHMIVVTQYGPEWVIFYDSTKHSLNDRPKLWRCGRPWFDAWWLGNSVVVLPDNVTLCRTPTPHLDDGWWEYVFPPARIGPEGQVGSRYPWYFWAWPGAKNLEGRPTTYNGPMKWTERTWTQECGPLPTDKPPPFMDGPPGTDAWNTRTKRWEKAPDPPGIHPWNL
jgi:hypothetical protein